MKRVTCLVAGLACFVPLYASASADPDTGPSAVAAANDYKLPPKPIVTSNLSREMTGPPAPVPLDQKGTSARIVQKYPPEAIRLGQQGTVGLEVRVSDSGRVTECSVTKSSGYLLLDEAACEGMVKYSQFAAARNAEGESEEGVFRTSIVFRLR